MKHLDFSRFAGAKDFYNRTNNTAAQEAITRPSVPERGNQSSTSTGNYTCSLRNKEKYAF